MRKVFGLMALAAVALQPAVAAAAPAAKAAPVMQARQQAVQLALVQNANSQKRPGQQEPVAGQSRRTTVLSRVLLFAPAAAVAGLLIALAAGGGRNTPISG